MSGDPEQEFFADGIAEDIITSLSRSRMFFVIARNSTFTYKGVSVDTRQVARELGVQYVVEGSVRRTGDRIRINGQLIDAPSGKHVWAERYEGELRDVFAVQDEITHNIVTAITPEFLSAEMYRARRSRRLNFDAWDVYMQAYWHYSTFTKQGQAEAKRLCRKAIAIDPGAAGPVALLSHAHAIEAIYGWSESRAQSLRAAHEEALNAIRLDDHDTVALRALGVANLFSGKHDDARRDFQRAIDLNPNESDNHALLGYVLGLVGEYEAALDHLKTAVRISPRDPLLSGWYSHAGVAAAVVGNDEQAIEWEKKAVQENRDFPGAHRTLAACYGNLGKIEEARAALGELLRVQPGLKIAQLRESLPIKNPTDLKRYLSGLRKAGLD